MATVVIGLFQFIPITNINNVSVIISNLSEEEFFKNNSYVYKSSEISKPIFYPKSKAIEKLVL